MILDKDVDFAIIGKSYLSFLLSFELLDKGGRILLVDDCRLKYGDLYSKSICHLEKELLQLWGDGSGIPPLANLNKYLKRNALTFVLGHTRLRLGANPRRNLLELMRKLPFCFYGNGNTPIEELCQDIASDDGSEFDELFSSFTDRIAHKIFVANDQSEIDFLFFYSEIFDDLKYYFESFAMTVMNDQLPTEERELLDSLIYTSRGYFHKRLATYAGKLELFHLFICMLSPHYELNEDSLLEDLKNDYVDRGGQFKETVINEWQFFKKRPWSIELASFDGIIRPKEIFLLGGIPTHMGLELHPPKEFFKCMRLEWTYGDDLAIERIGERIIFSSASKIGTDRPIIAVSFSKRRIVFRVFVKNQQGLKEEFIRTEVRGQIIKQMKEFMHDFPEDHIGELCSFSFEVLMEEELLKPKQRDGGIEKQKVEVRDASFPELRSELEGITYLGPYGDGPLGPLSTILDIKFIGK